MSEEIVKAPIAPAEEPKKEPSQEESTNVDNLLKELEDEGGEHKEPDEQKPEERKEPPSEEPSIKDLLSRIEKNEEETLDLKTENAFLRGKLTNQEKATKPPQEDVDEDDPDEVFDKKLRTNTVQALREREQKLLKKIEKKLQTQSTQQTEVNRIVESDRANAYGDFPDLKTNPELVQLADQYLAALIKRNGDRYMRGDIQLAARSAYVDLVRAGKIKLNGTKEEEKPEVKVRELVKKAGTDPIINSNTKTTPPSSEGRAFLDKFNRKEQESILRTCKKFDMTLDQYAANYQEAAGESSSYGRD